MTNKPLGPGDLALPHDPAQATDAGLVFIGRVGTPWGPGNCPHNLAEARSRGGSFTLHIDPPFRPALSGLSAGDNVMILTWMAEARRDLLVQAKAHRAGPPRGTFALRSPARPNPIGLAVVRITAIDAADGVVTIDALDAYDGTPIVDIKPWIATVDIPPGGATA